MSIFQSSRTYCHAYICHTLYKIYLILMTEEIQKNKILFNFLQEEINKENK